jgi:hypothetical protein
MKALFVVSLLLNLGLAGGTFAFRRASDKLASEARATERRISILETEKTAFLSSLGRVTPSAPYLVGMDAVGDLTPVS